jgi:sulfotransferase
MQTFHFISGLPRSGTTLLAAILAQNPHFHAKMSSPVSQIVTQAFNAMGKENEFALFITPEQRQAILTGIFTNYYQSLPAEIVFDTSRAWCSKLPLLKTLFPTAKVITCVRNLAWVMDSLESIIRRNPLQASGMFNNPGETATVYTRTEVLGQGDRLVGYAYNALKEAYYSPEAELMLLVDYEALTQAPAQVMQLVYQFIDQPYFDHDFNNLEYREEEFDTMMKTPDLHTVKRQVKYQPRATILPPDLFDKFSELSFWERDLNSQASRISKQD